MPDAVIDKPDNAAAGAAAPDASAGAAAGAAADKPAAKGVLDGGGAADDDAATGAAAAKAADWPDDWRSKISADEKAQKTLGRFASPKALYESYEALRQKLSSGELKANVPFPEKGTDEEKATWRKENGIPDKPEGYDFKVDEKADPVFKEVADGFLKYAVEKNLPKSAVKESLGYYAKIMEDRRAAQEEKDESTRAESEDALRAEWGSDYRGNVNRINALLIQAPEGVGDGLKSARMPDGTALANHPGVLRWLEKVSRIVDPVTTVTPGQGGDIAKNIADRMAEIQTMMANRQSEYWKGPKSAALQAEYRQLIENDARLKK